MGINQVVFSGRTGKDAELKYLDSGSVLTTFSLAVDNYKKGERGTIWLDCKAFGKTAEFIADYCPKGSIVTVSGKLDVEEWNDRESGQKRSKTVILVNDIQLPPKPKHSAPMDEPTQEDDIPF